MPRRGEARRDDEVEMPATIRRSPAKAQRTWKETHDSAVQEYGEGKTYGGLDYEGHTKGELIDIARQVGARVTTRMTKAQVAEAIDRKQ